MSYKKIINVLSIMVVLAFGAGLIHSIYFKIIPNQHFQYKMYRLLVLSLQKYLNKWIIISFLTSIVILLSLLVVRYIWESSLKYVFEINVKSDKKLKYIFFAILIGLILTSLGLWAINQFWISSHRSLPLDWLGIVGVLLFVLFLGFLLSYLKNIRKIALVLSFSLLILNMGIYIFEFINTPKGPNVILISIDTLRSDHLGCYGYDRNTSPNIDSFSKRNILFKNNFVQDNWTLPSHMSILTSLYPPTHSVRKKKSLAPSINTLPEVLKNEGYYTMGFAGDCIWMSAKYGFNHGFDSYIVKNYHPKNPELNAAFENKVISRYLQKYKKKKFFLFIHYFDVHSDFKRLPYDSPAPYKDIFFPDYTGDFDGGFGNILATKYLMYLNNSRYKIKEDDLKYIISLYDSGISFMDKCIGDLFNILRNMGLYHNSLIILTSDHGEEFREHGRMLHTQFYDEIMRVPLIVKLPQKNNKSEEIDELVESIDIMPSILEFLNIEKKPQMQGKSFINLINHTDNEEWKKHIFAFGDRGQTFIRTKKWKLLSDNLFNKDGYKLFNLYEDPSETQDVRNKYRKLTDRLKNDIFSQYNNMQYKSIERKVSLTPKEEEKLRSLGYTK